MELIHLVNFVISFLSHMTLLRWLTFPLGSLAVTLRGLFFWISFFFSDTSTCSKMTFPHWETLIMLLSQFTLNFCQSHKRMPSFTAYLDYSCVDWVGLHDHLRDVPLKDIFKLIEFWEWVHFFVCTNRANLLNLK